MVPMDARTIGRACITTSAYGGQSLSWRRSMPGPWPAAVATDAQGSRVPGVALATTLKGLSAAVTQLALRLQEKGIYPARAGKPGARQGRRNGCLLLICTRPGRGKLSRRLLIRLILATDLGLPSAPYVL